MAILISDAIFQQIRNITNDVQDTFEQKPAIYKKDKEVLSRWNRDIKASRQYDDIEINILAVWENKSETESTNTTDRKGSMDLTKGYFIMKFDDAESKGIIDNLQNFLVKTPQDLVEIDDILYELEGVNLLGQLKDKYTVVKFHIRKQMKQT